MTPGESEFVEEMGQFLASLGMTPMAGRMWGWLLICEPAEQTAAEIADALQASRGAISGTARLLANAGLVRRSTRPGDRKEYFSAPAEALDSMPKTRIRPLVGLMRSSAVRIVVVLPAPLGPRNPNTSPWLTVRSTSMTPRCSPYDLVSFSA
jgi:hypothetical protein